ncbi:colicin immunity domain-containing protein [Pseudomonas xantholysinigenes]|uniref:Colicin D immunity protein domain-containing protein n=1 Tax=Pseudomonas xantholysinigenes TaxID=2745490 RepID=A0A9E6PV36_9PSED|nr:colicin immunity domain-containing protein [Pseudomonas xantholysinigenes]QXI37031.1 hypothetical protein HU772_016965 [Pseudomonas xantholysinigenes]
MSIDLINLAKSAAKKEITADDFETKFFEGWRLEGESGVLAKDSKNIADCLYVIFDLAERYTSHPDRESYELDERALRAELEKALKNHGFL